MGLRRKSSPIPAVGLNSEVITDARVPAESAPLEFINQAAVSVKEAPAPMNCWYRVFSLTVMVWPAAALVAANAIGVCACRPRVTLRPPGSLVVVSQMLTGSAAADAAWAGMT